MNFERIKLFSDVLKKIFAVRVNDGKFILIGDVMENGVLT